MPTTQHLEKHFTASETIRDIVIGMSDGLTVPFALAAGLSGAVDPTSLVVMAGLADEHVARVVAAISAVPDRWVDFMMRFELALEKPDAGRARASAFTIAAAYVAGGLIPLGPYFFVSNIDKALWLSVAVTLVAL